MDDKRINSNVNKSYSISYNPNSSYLTGGTIQTSVPYAANQANNFSTKVDEMDLSLTSDVESIENSTSDLTSLSKKFLEQLRALNNEEIERLQVENDSLKNKYQEYLSNLHLNSEREEEIRKLERQLQVLYMNSSFNYGLYGVGESGNLEKQKSDLINEDLKEKIQYIKEHPDEFKSFVGMSFEEYNQKLEYNEYTILELKAKDYQLRQQAKEIPYLEIMETEDFQNYKQCYEGSSEFCTALLRTLDYLDYLDEVQLMMFNYLNDTKSQVEAMNYLKAIEDKINQAKGMKEAQMFFSKITDEEGNVDVNELEYTLTTMGQGLWNGVETFGEGFENLFDITSDGMITDNQYAQQFILQGLSEFQKQGQISEYIDDTYQISTSIGNMLPGSIISILTCGTVGQVLMGMSAAGNAKNQALVSMSDNKTLAYLYGALNGVSEVALGKLMGNIPGLNESAKFAAKEILSEGVEEFIQTYVDAGLKAAIYGDIPDLGELTEEALQSFLYGCITSGIMTGGQTAIKFTINGVKYSYNNITELINDYSDGKITSSTNNSNVEKINFTFVQDIAEYFGDSKLYLLGILFNKIKNKEIVISIAEMNSIKKSIYNGDIETINRIINFLDAEELKQYNKLIANERKSLQSEWISKLTYEEKLALRDYAQYFGSIEAYDAMEMYGYDSKGNSYVTITELMRAGLHDGDKNIDSAIEKFGILPNQIVTYRGVGIEALISQFGEIDINNLSNLIGKTYTDKAYMSTSLLKQNARAAVGNPTDVILEITVPNDANYGAYIESQSNLNYKQLEFLIKKNSQSIIENAYVNEDGKIVIEMKLCNPESNISNVNSNSKLINDSIDSNAIEAANYYTAKGITQTFRFSDVEHMPDRNSNFWTSFSNPELIQINVNGRIMTLDEAISHRMNYELNTKGVEIDVENRQVVNTNNTNVFSDLISKLGVNDARKAIWYVAYGQDYSYVPIELRNMLEGLSVEQLENFLENPQNYITVNNNGQIRINSLSDISLDYLSTLPKSTIFVLDDGSSLTYDSVKKILTNSDTIKNRLLSAVLDIQAPILKARKLYHELNKVLHYDMNFFVGDDELKYEILNNEVTFENLNPYNTVVCKGWSELYRELLISAGFDENQVKIVGNNHWWIEIDLGDGRIISADATEAINGSIDLSNCKAGIQTNGFFIWDSKNTGLRLKNIYKNNQKTLIEEQNKNLKYLDTELGYVGKNGYLADEIKKASSLFANSKVYQISLREKVQSIFDMDIPINMDGYESYAYYRILKKNILGDDCKLIEQKGYYRENNGTIEPVNYMMWSDQKTGELMIQVYSLGLGKIRFTNLTDFDNFMKMYNWRI